MAKTSSMYIRIDPEIKSEVEAIYLQYGMSITDAINIFIYQSRNVGGLPFDLRPSLLNNKTLKAMKEADKISESGNGKFKKAKDLLKSLKGS